jgi:hypothetical protein
MLFHMNTVQDNCINGFVKGILLNYNHIICVYLRKSGCKSRLLVIEYDRKGSVFRFQVSDLQVSRP